MPGQLDWFPLYTKNFQLSRKVRKMANDEVGMYLKLLIYQWEDGPVPLDIEDRAEICDCDADAMATAWKRIGPCYEKTKDGYVNRFLEEVRDEQLKKAKRLSRAGKAGAKARWDND